MSEMEAIKTAEKLKEDLDSLRPIDGESEKKIMQKFRLDWNYHSNNLEGNSLTYGETKALILFGITSGNKPFNDYVEMTGHNEAINWVLDIINDKFPLTEKFIRELHTLLLKETSFKEAKTAEGKPTRRKIEVGKYKTQPNHVVTATGETFYFASPEETPAKMEELIAWFKNEKEKSDVNPILLASLFHYKFIRIHPFDDGNGRVARILMNFILMQFGYPPVIIKTEDKENYYAVLRLADANEIDPFIRYIAQNLVHSLEIMIKGAKGEDIEEPDDLDKEIALLDVNLKNIGLKVEKIRNETTLREVLENSLTPLIEKFVEDCKKFDRFYLKSTLSVIINDSAFTNLDSPSLLSNIKNKLANETESVRINYDYQIFNHSNFGEFNYNSHFMIFFHHTEYGCQTQDGNLVYKKLYSESLSKDEVGIFVHYISKEHLDSIKHKKSFLESPDALD